MVKNSHFAARIGYLNVLLPGDSISFLLRTKYSTWLSLLRLSVITHVCSQLSDTGIAKVDSAHDSWNCM